MTFARFCKTHTYTACYITIVVQFRDDNGLGNLPEDYLNFVYLWTNVVLWLLLTGFNFQTVQFLERNVRGCVVQAQ